MSGEMVLVTGGSGFLGAHCIARLLAAGYRVRTTVRAPEREDAVRAMVAAGGATADAPLTFAVADLTADAGWPEAVAGCAFVLHVASPFPAAMPDDEDELIVPARDGALRVLRAARDAGVRRVVLTSSFAAIGYGHGKVARPFTEEDWTAPDAPGVNAYVRSKTLAERAAWAFVADEGGDLELAVINPVGIFGPALGTDVSSSIQIVRSMLAGEIPTLPPISTNVVDVRDVADLHLRAMTDPAARGERFLAVAGEPLSLREVALIVRARLGDEAARVPTRQLPAWLIRLVARVMPDLRAALPELGIVRHASGAKARRVLGWTLRSNEEAIVATAESLVRLGREQPPETID